MKFKSLVLSSILALCSIVNLSAKELVMLNIEVKENKEVISNTHMIFTDEEDIVFTNDLTFSGYPVGISYNGIRKNPENYISMRRTEDQKSIVEFELNGCYSKNEIDFKLNDKHLLTVCSGNGTIKITKEIQDFQ